jgi:T-complex protein 1 subunit beta
MADVCEMEILELFMVKYYMLISAAEAAELILRIDDIIKRSPRQRQPDNRPC